MKKTTADPYVEAVKRTDRALDCHLGRIFPILLRIAVRDVDDLGTEARIALVDLMKARAALKMLHLQPVQGHTKNIDGYLVGLDKVITPRGRGREPYERAIIQSRRQED